LTFQTTACLITFIIAIQDLLFLTLLHEDNLCIVIPYNLITQMDLFAYFLIRVTQKVHSINVMFHNKKFTFSLLLFDFDSTAIRLSISVTVT